MDGIHDLGGMQGFGPATWPGADAVMPNGWDARAFALAMVSAPRSTHQFRHTIERIGPARYLAASYYEKWLWEAEQALVETGAITHAEVDAWAERLAHGEAPPRTEDPERTAKLLTALATSHPMPEAAAPAFAVGDRVHVKRMRPAGHTRCPRYLRGATGEVVDVRGDDGVPDVDNAEREAVYAVRFRARELWGPDAEDHVVLADLWERYLEAA
jgi:nitrile hydratase beta subunit